MRLIDADALPKYTGYAMSANEVAMAVENAPTIDAVPVVRCRECIHNYGLSFNKEFNPNDIVCDYWDTDGLSYYDFCSYGKRKDGDGE